MGVPSRSAYQELITMPELSVFRGIVERSTRYRQLLDQVPQINYNQNQQYFNPNRAQRNFNPNATKLVSKRQMANPIPQQIQPQQQPQFPINQQNQYNPQQQFQFSVNNNYQMLTILAPSDAALIGIRDDLMRNDSAIDEFLSTHIIVDSSASNRVFFTDHDESVFINGQTYRTMRPQHQLIANVLTDPSMVSNIVSLSFAQNPSIRTRITSGNNRVMNGVIHVVDKALTTLSTMDIASLLDKVSTINNPGSPAFNQFVDILRNTGVLNDLRQQGRRFTLFIPTNEALARYQDILNSNDFERKRRLIYRHMCLDQNLQSNVLTDQYGQQIPQNNQIMMQQQQLHQNQHQLICRNALGQDLTLTKDNYGLISSFQGQAQSKVLNDYSGVYSSAYVLEQPLLNQNLPNYGLNSVNNAFSIQANKNAQFKLLFLSFFVCSMFSSILF
jgi:hypothetical protein